MRFLVISAKERSTRLSQDALVGVMWQWNPGCFASHAFTSGVLCSEVRGLTDAAERVAALHVGLKLGLPFV